ncbi:MAG TPA: DNA polymerase I [Vicinamibacterales bacterium]
MTPKRLFLIDGSNQMYRAYHALPGMTGPDGRTTHAVYGFVTMLRKLIEDHHPEYIAAAFDLAGPTFRRELAADYKANRRPMPPDLVEQVPLVHEACEALGVPILSLDRFEADDVMGTIARRGAEQGFEIVLVTGDKDFFQLVGGPIRVYNPRDDGTWYDEEGVIRKFGVRPDQVIDVLALMGDTIDNVKGVPGIGEKGARDLIATYGSLEALLAAAPTLPQKRYREALMTHAESARQSRELVTLHTDLPVPFEPEAYRYRGPDRARAFDIFCRLGFRSLTTAYAPTAEAVERDYALLDSPEAIAAFVADARKRGAIALHVLSDGDSAMRATLVGLSFSLGPRHARYLPLAGSQAASGRADESPGLFDEPQTASATAAGAIPADIARLLEDDRIAKTGHGLKDAAIILAQHGVTLRGALTDTEIISYIIDATRSEHRIEDLALEQVGYRARLQEDICGKGAKAVALGSLAPEAILVFAGERADLAGQLAEPLRRTMRDAGLERVYEELELPLLPVLVDIERVGVRIDADVLAHQGSRVEAELNERAERIYAMAGERFNINSPKQLGDVLFTKLKLPALKRTGKARTASTAQEVLEELALIHDLPREVIEWRALQKLKGTYIDALPQLTHPVTGRVHTSFSQTTAATGRLSSRDPNLQNVPIRTELGREIRRAFVAEPGWLLISADYSQIELRVLAHLSGDASLTEAFRRHEDIHDRTALKVFGPDSGLSKHELRRRAKIINYALLYGKTAFTLAKDIGVTPQAAQAFIDAYFAGFPAVRAYLDGTIAKARETGAVTTMYGRRRLVPDINSRNGQVRAAAERVAVNMPIQGTAADILKRAMIDLHAALAKHGGLARGRMILTVHDELLLEARQEAVDEIAALVKDRMESAAKLDVPLTVDIGIGENWKEAKE